MLQDIVMPKLGLTMSEGTVAKWLVTKGQPYKKGDPIFEAVTDKITFTVEAQTDGLMVEILVSEGDTVPVGAPVARAEVASEARETVTCAESSETSAEAVGIRDDKGTSSDAASDAREAGACRPPEAGAGRGDGSGVVPASPAAKRLAREHNVDLAVVRGTGPGGRVVEGDVRAFLDKMLGVAADVIASATGTRRTDEPGAPPEGFRPSGTRTPYTAIGRTSAERTTRSFRTAPHFYISMDVDATSLLAFRERAIAEAHRVGGGQAVRPSLNDIIVRAVAKALAEHRYANASADDDGIVVHHEINIGIAVATDQGLVVPVVRNADAKTLVEITLETRELTRRAREGRLEPQDVSGGTFTVSNLGMFGVDELCAIINPPQAAILGVGAVRELPVVRGGAVVPGMVMRLTLSADHRVLDGASAAAFLGGIKTVIESLQPQAAPSL